MNIEIVVVVSVSLSIFYIFQVTTLFPFLVMLFTFSPLGWSVKFFLAVKFPLAPFASPHYSIWLDGQTLPFFDVARNVCLSPKPLPSDVLKKVLNCQGWTFVLCLLFCSNHLHMSSKLQQQKKSNPLKFCWKKFLVLNIQPMQGINGQAAMTSCFKGLYFLINYNFLATASDTSVSYQAIKQKFFQPS